MPGTINSATAAIAHELVSMCRSGNNLDAIEKFYAPNIVSIEPIGNDKMPAEIKGIDAVRKKNEWWSETNEVHHSDANGPYVGEDQFAVNWVWDFTNKETGRRVKMNEMALYTVKDDKIVREQFFYHAQGA